MSKTYFCETCDVSFSSWRELKEHRRSKEHKENAVDSGSRAIQLLNRIAARLKESEKKSDESNNV